MISAVAGKGIFGFERSFARNLPVSAGKVRFLGRAQQFLETLDHEIDALEFVEMIFGPHHALDIEPDAPRFGRGERRNRLGMARQQPAAEGAQFALLDDKPELGRIEPEPAEEIGRAEPFGAQSRLAVGDQKFGEGGVGEHRDMAENIVKHVRLFAVADLLGRPQEIGGGKAAVRQMLEKGLVRYPARNRDDLPAGRRLQMPVESGEIGNPPARPTAAYRGRAENPRRRSRAAPPPADRTAYA